MPDGRHKFQGMDEVGGETESVLAAERLKTRCLNHGEKQSVDSKHSAFLKILGKPLGRCRMRCRRLPYTLSRRCLQAHALPEGNSESQSTVLHR